MEMTMIWIWQGEGLKNLFIPKYVSRWFFLSFSSLALQVCSEALHSPWCPHSARACTKLLVLKCGQANNTGHLRTSLTYHWKKLDLPTVFTCWKVLHTSLFQSRPSPLGNTPSIWLQVCSIQWGIWPKMTPAQLAIWFCVKTCQRCRQKDFLKFFPHSVCVPCSWASALIFAVLLEHLTAFEKAQAFWNEQFYWNEQTSVRQLSKTLDISVVFSRTLTLK